MQTRAAKDSIRRTALFRRGAIDPDERAVRGAQIAERLLGLDVMGAAGTVLAFVSIRSEVPTDVLLRAILAAGKALLLPYVADDGSMRASPVASLDELSPGFRGIPEPRARLPVEPTTADVIVVPGVAFDERGGRIGYGGGFYDRFLKSAPGVPRVGVCFEAQLVDEVPMEPHDERVDMLVTDERTLDFRARRRVGS